MTKVSLIDYQTGKFIFEYENSPQYLPREGEYINLNNSIIFKVLKVVHEITYDNTINIYVTSNELKR